MTTTAKGSSVSSVSTDEGSNYAGQQGGFSGGLKESDKQYLSTLLSSAQSSGRRSSEAHQAKSPVVGNYYGSMIGNVPLFARQGVTLPVDTIDDMYQKDQLMKMVQLKQEAIKIPEISRGAFNEVYFNNWKSLTDHLYKETTAAFNGDSNKARTALSNDMGFRHINTQLDKVAQEYNTAIKTISDIMSDADSDKYIPPSVMRKMTDILNHPEVVDKSFKRDDKGNVISVDLQSTNELLNTFQTFPSILKSTKDITSDFERKIAGDMNPAHFGNSSNDAFMAYTSVNANFDKTSKDSEGNTIPSELDTMTDTVMQAVYGGIDDKSPQYKETRGIVKDTINLRVKRAVERQYQVLSSENAKKNLLMDSVGMSDAEGLAYDVGGKTFTPSKLKNVIGFAPDKYYQNPSTVGIRPGERLVSPNRPGVMFELMEPEKLEYSLVSQYTGEYTVDPVDYLAMPAFIQKEITKNKGKVSTGGLYTFKIPTASLNIRSIEKGSMVTTKDGRSVSQTDAYASTYKVKVYSEEFPQGKEEEWSGDISVLTSANDVNYIARQENQGFALKYAKDSQDNSSKGAWTRTEIVRLGDKSSGGVTSMGLEVKEKQNLLPEKVDFGTLGTKK